jgi:hypothetical protein
MLRKQQVKYACRHQLSLADQFQLHAAPSRRNAPSAFPALIQGRDRTRVPPFQVG